MSEVSGEPPNFWMMPLNENESGGGGATMRLGLDEAFAEALGAPVVAIELAPEGTRLKAGDTFGFVQTATRSRDLRAPRAMRILAVNADVLREPRLAAAASTGRGWLVEIEIMDAQ